MPVILHPATLLPFCFHRSQFLAFSLHVPLRLRLLCHRSGSPYTLAVVFHVLFNLLVSLYQICWQYLVFQCDPALNYFANCESLSSKLVYWIYHSHSLRSRHTGYSLYPVVLAYLYSMLLLFDRASRSKPYVLSVHELVYTLYSMLLLFGRASRSKPYVLSVHELVYTTF